MKKGLLFLSVIFSVGLNAQIIQDCSDLFISEYVEGPAQSNAIEIYNPTSSTIDLSGYTLNRYSNGASSGPEVFSLSGSVGPGDVIVVGNGQLDSIDLGTYWSVPVDAALYALLDDHCNGDYNTNSTFYFNGNDAMTLEYGSTTIDIFGKVGEDPGSAWTDDASAGYTDANGGTWWTKRQTLIRKPFVYGGVTQNPIVFNPTLQYDSLPDATYSNLGVHDCDCSATVSANYMNDISYVMYPNPATTGEQVSVNSSVAVREITATNILGEQVIFTNSINKLSKGTYIINIEFINGSSVQNKLVIK